MRRSSLAVLRSQLHRGHLLWPLRQALKWPAHRLGDVLGRPLAGPILASWFTTYACNLRCRFCDLPGRASAGGSAGAPLTRAEKLAVIEDLAAIGTAAVGFTGGEPALDPDLEALIRDAAARGLVTHLSTNGLAFASDASAARLLQAGLHAVSFSIDGATAATHDALRGRDGSFDEVVGALERCLRARRGPGLAISTATVLGAANLEEVPRLVARLESLGVDQVGVMPLHDFDGGEVRCPRLDPAALRQLDAAVDLLLAHRRGGTVENTPAYLDSLRGAFRGRPFPVRCYAGLVSIVIDPWGDLYPCIPFAQLGRSFGNVRETPLRRFWAGEGARRMRAAAESCRRCYWNCHAELSLLMAGPTWGAGPREAAA